MNLSTLLNSAAGIALGAYIIAVTVNGNLMPNSSKADLADYVIADAVSYTEFLVAMAAIWALLEWGPSKEIVGPIVVVAVLGVILKAGASNSQLLAALANFGQPDFLQQLAFGLGLAGAPVAGD